MKNIDTIANRLAPHYSNFNVQNRLLFTGHSHQAWPDVALEGLKDAFHTAARRVDDKWDIAFEKTEVLRNYLRNYYDDPDGYYCLGQNTHQLMVAWLSSFDLKTKPKIITTSGEFHSMFRQLHRLEEEGIQIEMVDPGSGNIANKIAQLSDSNTAAIMLSRVFFESGLLNLELTEIARTARSKDIPVLIDDYHGTNVAPLSLPDEGLQDCFLLIGGYKYLQWGEGNCFLRFPKGCRLRPAITGWFAAFESLDKPRSGDPVEYDDGNQRFASGTYDPSSQFRAARVVDFFEEHGLTPEVLSDQYRQQVDLLRQQFLERKLAPSLITLKHRRPIEENGGFLALQSPFARTIRAMLLDQGVFTDARGDILRLGPAPYTTTDQIKAVIQKLASVVNNLNP